MVISGGTNILIIEFKGIVVSSKVTSIVAQHIVENRLALPSVVVPHRTVFLSSHSRGGHLFGRKHYKSLRLHHLILHALNTKLNLCRRYGGWACIWLGGNWVATSQESE